MLDRIVSTQIRRTCCAIGNRATYEVAISFVNPSIRDDYIRWLSERHIAEVLQFDGFVSAELLHEYASTSLVVQYLLESPSVFDEYNKSETARRLRSEAIEKFGNAFTATRRVLVRGEQFWKYSISGLSSSVPG